MTGIFRTSKKGIMAFNYLVMIPRIIFLVIQLIACVILISMFLNNKFDVTNIQAEVVINGLLYSPGGIGYFDPVSGRVYPEIIDIDQINSSELDDALFYPANNIITAKVDVRKAGFVGLTDATTRRTVYYNKEWYDNWEPLMNWGIGGIGGVKKYEKELPVLLRTPDGRIVSGQVDFQVVQPRSIRGR